MAILVWPILVGASGHFVKMVHNGIEYAMMQILAETYYLLKNGMGYDNEQIYNTFKNGTKAGYNVS